MRFYLRVPEAPQDKTSMLQLPSPSTAAIDLNSGVQDAKSVSSDQTTCTFYKVCISSQLILPQLGVQHFCWWSTLSSTSFTHRTASSSKISQREVFSKAQASLQQAGFSQSQDPSPRPRTNFFQKKKIDLRHYLSKVECRHWP